jgi:protein ImuB
MSKRFLTIWFRHLTTDWFSIRRPDLRNAPFVLAAPDRGRKLVTAANLAAQAQGIDKGMAAADARAIIPSLQVLDERPALANKLLKALGEWCIRYTPLTAIDPPDGLILDITGCSHLWGGEKTYLVEIARRLQDSGYDTRVSIADTIGAAWAISRFGKITPASHPTSASHLTSASHPTPSARLTPIIGPGGHATALLDLPPAALRLEPETLDRLYKLGLTRIGNIIHMPRSALRRRFGPQLLLRIDQALGREEEAIRPLLPIIQYQERLPCLEPIVTATGIGIALQRLLETLCSRLQQEGKGLRTACFSGYRVDGKIEQIGIGTNRPSRHIDHLFRLFENKIATMEPDLGIELFTLDAPKVEELSPLQERLWEGACGLEDIKLSELLDRLGDKIGTRNIHRYLPDEHHWPERSIKPASSLIEIANTPWRTDRPRPIQLLSRPEPIEVTAPIPDYPPMLFRYKNILHKIIKADGPERIEREWWLEEGPHRDYYAVEDEAGARYWLFRSGHYSADKPHRWFIHGFFA